MSRKRGRPRNVTAQRFPDGSVHRRSALQVEQDAMLAAREARTRLYGFPESRALSRIETSFLGGLYAREELTEQEYRTAEAYREFMWDYHHQFPTRPVPEAGNLDRGPDWDDSDGTDQAYIDRQRLLTGIWSKCRVALRAADEQDWRASLAVRHIVLEDFGQPTSNREHMVPALRIGLKALAKVFHIPKLDRPREEAVLQKITIPEIARKSG